jgi:hypothetical protein
MLCTARLNAERRIANSRAEEEARRRIEPPEGQVPTVKLAMMVSRFLLSVGSLCVCVSLFFEAEVAPRLRSMVGNIFGMCVA